MQTEECRPGVKCRLGSKRINPLWLQYQPDREAQERSVERLEACDKDQFQDQAYLRSAKQRYEIQVFIAQVIEIADVWWKSIATIFEAEQSIHELHVC